MTIDVVCLTNGMTIVERNYITNECDEWLYEYVGPNEIGGAWWWKQQVGINRWAIAFDDKYSEQATVFKLKFGVA